jgi:hypothetical protein
MTLAARATVSAWVLDYKTERPHSSLGYATPTAYAAEIEKRGPGLAQDLALHQHTLSDLGSGWMKAGSG